MESKAVVPVQQALVPFHGYGILSVRLPDDHVATSHSELCHMLNVARHGQIERIRRDKKLSEQLVLVRVETAGGPQDIEVLIVDAIPEWVLGIQINKLAPEKRSLLLALKAEAFDVFYGYFFGAHSRQDAQQATKQLPEPDDRWEQLYQIIAGFETEWRSMKTDMAAMKSDIARLKAAQGQKPAGAAKGAARQAEDRLSPDHFLHLYVLARSLESRTGEPLGAVMRELAAAFQVPDIGELPDSAWDAILSWFWQRSQR
ncbi:MAG TPA: phage antirepressor N-terminal domain-containing protein [Ktedonobacterales bacterium]|nr:phage antirepressor N-terminal domain-containing protein [Ktedonobacterales bacterium]